MFISWVIGLIHRAAIDMSARKRRSRNRQRVRREIEALPSHLAADLGWRAPRD